ncbi:hypothetical protein [uncultured Microbacterium sp.]|uniref:hypothetical protein n=1 Tax=uncultured Microbacterium sp. TaxID=191216 RepID=UPI0028DC7063|nr:hypothetical protein [uncultured Microbacterium sp.]
MPIKSIPADVTGAPRPTCAQLGALHDGVREIEADDMPALEAKVPDGGQMLSVRRV